MRRTDRLFEIIRTLRDGRLHTARTMAERLEVSVRTSWRDMATLIASGLPVEGERGVGYILREPIALSPLTLTPDEVMALTLGLKLVSVGADPSLAPAAASLRAKVDAVIPARLLPGAEDGHWVYPGTEALAAARHLPGLRRAVRIRERVILTYRDGDGRVSLRPVRPLILEYWGRVWTLATWCETRAAFRSFRVDRIDAVTASGDIFPDDSDRGLAAYRVGLSG